MREKTRFKMGTTFCNESKQQSVMYPEYIKKSYKPVSQQENKNKQHNKSMGRKSEQAAHRRETQADSKHRKVPSLIGEQGSAHENHTDKHRALAPSIARTLNSKNSATLLARL